MDMISPSSVDTASLATGARPRLQTRFALVDVNNFYCSCEAVLTPGWRASRW